MKKNITIFCLVLMLFSTIMEIVVTDVKIEREENFIVGQATFKCAKTNELVE